MRYGGCWVRVCLSLRWAALCWLGWAGVRRMRAEPLRVGRLAVWTVWAERARKEGGDAQRPRTPGAMQAQAAQERSGQVDWMQDAGQSQIVRSRWSGHRPRAGTQDPGASSLRIGARRRGREQRRPGAHTAAHAAHSAQPLCCSASGALRLTDWRTGACVRSPAHIPPPPTPTARYRVAALARPAHRPAVVGPLRH